MVFPFENEVSFVSFNSTSRFRTFDPESSLTPFMAKKGCVCASLWPTPTIIYHSTISNFLQRVALSHWAELTRYPEKDEFFNAFALGGLVRLLRWINVSVVSCSKQRYQKTAFCSEIYLVWRFPTFFGFFNFVNIANIFWFVCDLEKV